MAQESQGPPDKGGTVVSGQATDDGSRAGPQIEIVVPVLNEETALGPSIRRLVSYLRTGFPFQTIITIADNGSSDNTWTIAGELAAELAEVRAVRLAERGKGLALRECWLATEADVVAYPDVDLSSGLEALLPLVAPLLSGHSDIAIGTRLAWGARVARGPRREVISRCYNLLLQTMLDASFSDASCGFKAIRADKARWLLPLVQDNTWFFDTELLILGERAGLRVHEVPVDWIDDPDSRVDVVRTAAIDLRGVARLCWSSWRGTLAGPGQVVAPSSARGSVRGLPGQVLRFMGIGVVSLLAYVGIFLATRVEFSVQVANVIGLVLTTAGNIAANRRITFGIRGHAHVARDQIQWALAFSAGLALTEVALASLRAVAPRPSQFVELMTLITANLVASLVRFILFRSWVFRPRQLPPPPRVAVGTGPATADLTQ